ETGGSGLLLRPDEAVYDSTKFGRQGLLSGSAIGMFEDVDECERLLGRTGLAAPEMASSRRRYLFRDRCVPPGEISTPEWDAIPLGCDASSRTEWLPPAGDVSLRDRLFPPGGIPAPEWDAIQSCVRCLPPERRASSRRRCLPPGQTCS